MIASPSAPSLADVRAELDRRYPPAWAESWDAVGLTCGDPAEPVRRVHAAVDAVPATVEEAIAAGADLLITHHPLLLSGVHGVPADDPKGALVHRMIRAGLAHFVAHTNADVADPGVSDALAARIGLTGLAPLDPQTDPALHKIVVFVPRTDAEAVVDAMSAAGAGRIGAYDRAAFLSDGTGTFRPGSGARPTIGEPGRIEIVPETRVEMVAPPAASHAVIAAMRGAHPYEEPAFDVYAHVPQRSRRGTGRVGLLPEATTLERFVTAAAAALPATAIGLRAAGDPARAVRRVAVCGGSGSPFVEDARRAGADVYLTADLKHHSVVEAVTERGHDAMALVDAGHWATEAPWLDVLADDLRAAFGTTVDVTVSTLVTDPWSLHTPSRAASGPGTGAPRR